MNEDVNDVPELPDEPAAGAEEPDGAAHFSPASDAAIDPESTSESELEGAPERELEPDSALPVGHGPVGAGAAPRLTPGVVRRHPAVTAVGISVLVHVVLGVGAYWALRSLHLFTPARFQFSEGDGAVETGVMDHAGADDLAPGAEGTGAPVVGWSGFHGSSGGGIADPGDDPAGLRAAPPPPAPAPPPAVPDAADAAEADDAPPPVVDLPDPLDPENWPKFTPKPPPGVPDAPADAPPATPPTPAPASATTAPAAQVAQAAQAPQAATSDPAGASSREATGGASGVASAAGFSAPGGASGEPGGLIRRPGTGGSGGAGGATSGAGGGAVTGRPGLRGAAPRPVYPALSQRLGEQGTVVLEIEVLENGATGSVRVLTDAGYPRLSAAALDAVRGIHFYPALLDGKPVRSYLRYPFEFKLRSR